MLSNVAKVTALVSGRLGPDRQADREAWPPVPSPLDRPGVALGSLWFNVSSTIPLPDAA